MSESTPFKVDFDFGSDSSPHHDDSEELLVGRQMKPAPKSRVKDIILLMSVITNVLVSLAFVILLLSWKQSSQRAEDGAPDAISPLVPPGIDEQVIVPVKFGWEYYAETVGDMDQVDRNWDAINSDVGVVSAPHADFLRWGVLPGKDDPQDPSKGIHSLRAYHSLHCLKVVRHTMIQLANGEKLDMTFGHAMHCLGSLLQDIVCYADDSMPLRGKSENGDYQYVRKCRNWAAMNKWAGQRTTCMTTSLEGILDLEHQNLENCTRTDGVLIPTV